MYDFWDIEKLANEILELASGSPLRHVLIRNMQAEQEGLSWNDIAKRVEKIYNRLDKHKD